MIHSVFFWGGYFEGRALHEEADKSKPETTFVPFLLEAELLPPTQHLFVTQGTQK